MPDSNLRGAADVKRDVSRVSAREAETAEPGAGAAPAMPLPGREPSLLRRAQAGDTAAFEALYRGHVARVYALCLRLSGRAPLADELTQETFVRAWMKLPGFRHESSFATWLHRIAVNLALEERRSRGRREARIQAADDLTMFATPSPARRGEAALDLERAVAALPEGARAVFVLHDVEGYRHEEIAALTGVAVGTSKAQLHRARRLLREVLEP